MGQPGNEFARLLVTHDRQILRYIMALVPRRDDAEEVLQRTAIVLWEKFSDYDQERDFLPWALRVAYYEVLNFRKEKARSRLVFSEEVVALLVQTRTEQQALLDQRRTALGYCLTELSVEDRTLLERRYTDAATIRALSEERGRTVKALYRRLDRIREMIMKCVEQRVALAGKL
jgi:RNA polymerase sigma-70 factor (ECF subfamily)